MSLFRTTDDQGTGAGSKRMLCRRHSGSFPGGLHSTAVKKRGPVGKHFSSQRGLMFRGRAFAAYDGSEPLDRRRLSTAARCGRMPHLLVATGAVLQPGVQAVDLLALVR